jgi:outer membrane protein insertion porin family
VRKGIKRTFLKGIFDDIAVDVSDGENPDIVITVREREFIRKIHIRGDHPVSRKDIARIFLLKEDDIMRYDLLERSEKELKDRLAFYGYPQSAVNIAVLKDKEPYKVNIYLTIEAGSPIIVKALRFTGTDLNPAEFLKIKEGDVFNQERLGIELNRFSEQLKKDGYYRPVVGPWTFANGEVEIPVDTGKKLNIDIQGNRILSEKVLLRESAFFETESFSDEAVSEAVDRMLSAYHLRGYASAQIAPVISDGDKNIQLNLFVFEGEKYRVGKIRFIGSNLPHGRLEDIMELKRGGLYNPDLLERDRNSIGEIYAALGYLETEVKEIDAVIDETSRTAALTIGISEGERTVIRSIEIRGVEPALRKDLLDIIGIREGDPYNEVDISDARFRIMDYYSILGYPNIDVAVSRISEEKGASLEFVVSEGSKKFIGKTVITGNERTRHRVIERELQNR